LHSLVKQIGLADLASFAFAPTVQKQKKQAHGKEEARPNNVSSKVEEKEQNFLYSYHTYYKIFLCFLSQNK
jgi:hypothetical protein